MSGMLGDPRRNSQLVLSVSPRTKVSLAKKSMNRQYTYKFKTKTHFGLDLHCFKNDYVYRMTTK